MIILHTQLDHSLRLLLDGKEEQGWSTPCVPRPLWEVCRIGPPPKVHLSVSIPCKKGWHYPGLAPG